MLNSANHDHRNRTVTRVIDANGLVVCPGFIDMLGQSEIALLIDNRSLNKLSQGITTEITGEGQSELSELGRLGASLLDRKSRECVKCAFNLLRFQRRPGCIGTQRGGSRHSSCCRILLRKKLDKAS